MSKLRLVLVLTMLVLFVLGTGLQCLPLSEPEEAEEQVIIEETVDEEALLAVYSYAAALTQALLEETLHADLRGWSRDPHITDDLPFRYDEQRRLWLAEHRVALRRLQREHRGEGRFPLSEEIAAWNAIAVRDGEEWYLDGEAYLAALEELEELYSWVDGVLGMILLSGGQLTEEESRAVLELLEDLEPAVAEVQSFFSRPGH